MFDKADIVRPQRNKHDVQTAMCGDGGLNDICRVRLAIGPERDSAGVDVCRRQIAGDSVNACLVQVGDRDVTACFSERKSTGSTECSAAPTTTADFPVRSNLDL